MPPILIHDRSELEEFFRRDPALHLYELGDLDDFFWPYTTWYALKEQGRLCAALLLYSGGDLPILLATGRPEENPVLTELLRDSLPLLPRRFYMHISPGLASVLSPAYTLEGHGLYLKMALSRPECIAAVDTHATEALAPADVQEIGDFYEQAYPGNWFDPRMLETGCYYGVRREGRLAAISGIHTYSPAYRAAALGNITTLPQYRGQGLATQATAQVCKRLLENVDWIGLNVKADNTAALAMYTRLGFEPAAAYEEYMVVSSGNA
jgi:ribosomal protein S18 acetylase RimI-like enzyme